MLHPNPANPPSPLPPGKRPSKPLFGREFGCVMEKSMFHVSMKNLLLQRMSECTKLTCGISWH